MTPRSSLSPFRVFGSPYTLSVHQFVAYLRLRQLPFKVYCTNITTTYLYALYYRAKGSFCTLSPNGVSHLQVWQLAETTELDEDVEALAAFVNGEVTYTTTPEKSNSTTRLSSSNTTATPARRSQQMLIHRSTHPHLHLADWCLVVYACWWLSKTGAMYRYIRSEALDTMEGFSRFLLLPGISFPRTLAPKLRAVMKMGVAATGVTEESAPYMDEHFMRFCAALEAHLRDHPCATFLLCTPHPTLADVTIGAVFSGYFLMDEPPASVLGDRFPCIVKYVERVTGWRGSTYVEAPEGDTPAADGVVDSPLSTATSADTGPSTAESDTDRNSGKSTKTSQNYPDTVPESLAPVFALIAEVFPFLMSQCVSFNAFMAGDGVRTLKRVPLQGPWEGCEGYLLPQMSNIKSLMIIDNAVMTVMARAQDLELVFLAAREVHDDALRDFGRVDDNAKPLPTKSTSSASQPSYSHGTNSTGKKEGGVADASASDDAHLTAATSTKGGEEAGPVVVASDGRAPLMVRPMDPALIMPEEADFYHAFTTEGRRAFGGDATSLSKAVPTARSATMANSASIVLRSSVLERLETLRTMLNKMGCLQYTLSSVHQGRRAYVAVIPEHEVAKRRQALQAAAAETAHRP